MNGTHIFIISGPSGAGEDSVIKGLQKKRDFDRVITTTTRAVRPEDQPGRTYYFVSKEEFEQGIKENRFFEYALADRGNYYGGTYSEIERVKKSPLPVLWKIDYQGVLTAKKLLPEAKSIFIFAPPEVLRQRLLKRGESEEMIRKRLEYAKGWYENEGIFDYKVENKEGKLEETIEKVLAIIQKNL